MKEYKEFQFAWWLVIAMTGVFIINTSLYLGNIGDRPIPFGGLLIFVGASLLAFALFYGMTTKIDSEKITILFGIGLIRKRIAIDKVKQVTIVKNPWYYGRGIRFIPKGRLYNIAGSKGIELNFYSTESIIRIGTKDPAQLKTEIEKFVKP